MTIWHLKALSSDPKATGSLLAIGAAGLWPNERVNQAKPEVSPECILCGAPVQDEGHVAGDYDHIAESDDPRIQTSNFLRKAALATGPG